MEKLKIAIIGVGGISGAHIDAYQRNPHVELYAFCEINKERLEQKGAMYGITRLYTDEDEMLAALPEIDAVSVCVWNCNHAKCAIKALDAGKHVLCEKPIAKTVEEAEQMLAAAKRNNRLLMVGFCCRFGKDAEIIRNYQEKDFFGDIYYAKASQLRRNGNPGGWFCNKSMSGGGPLIDLGVHMIDLAIWLMGSPTPVAVTGSTYCKFADNDVSDSVNSDFGDKVEDGTFDVEDLAMGTIRFDNGAQLQIEFSWASNVKKETRFVELRGTKAGLNWQDGEVEFYTEEYGKCLDVIPTNYATDREHARNLRHFYDVVIEGAEPCFKPQQGIDMIKILCAVYESARTGREVVL